MDKFIEAILALQPFGRLFQKLGLNDKWSALLSLVLISLIIAGIVALYKFLFKYYKAEKDALEDIKPQFDHLSIKKARQFYIQTQYQNASPARQEEPGFTHKFIARNKLIPFFTKTAFNEKVDSERFYLILADSGMGKTTFMINLYLRYNSRFNFSRKKDEMKLFRFSNPDTIAQIKAISADNAKKTILLLDALDEDRGIISTDPGISDAQAFQKRIDEIIEITRNFKEVVITCRTQYFPGQEEDPYELKIKRPDEKGFYTLNKLYISPFNEREVEKYLNKKFGIIPFINQKKKRKALEIVSKSKNLVMRPMLLSYIDYLIEDEMIEVNACNIYEKLISKWLLREAEKRKRFADREDFMKNLRDLSLKAAIVIHSNWRNEGRMYLSKEEAVKIAKQFEIKLDPEEITGQSLLTCDGVGNWKFAHKSILEFFLAREAVHNLKFLKDMNFKGMDMARKFYEESNPAVVFIDPVKRIVGPYDELGALPGFYIHGKAITYKKFDALMRLNEPIIPKIPHSEAFRLKHVIAFCNEINIVNGYPPAYISMFDINLLGIIKTNNEQFQGFRLPTDMELRSYFINKYYLQHHKYRDTSRIKRMAQLSIKFVESTIVEDVKSSNITTSANIGEWCCGDEGISEFRENDLFPTTSDGIQYKLKSCVNPIPIHRIEEEELSFRLVFIP
jgi:hypothetical protein